VPVVRELYGQPFDVQESEGGKPLPKSFLIAPGIYQTAGSSWDMREPGLYHIFNPNNGQTARRGVTASEPLEMASVISHASRHSNRDNSLTAAKLNEAARSRFVGLTCGAIHPWLRSWMLGAGWQARIVRFLTMDTPNWYSNGHVAMECRRNVSGYPWTLVDADLGRYYEDGEGNRLSAHSFTERVADWEFTIKPLSGSRLDTAAPATSFDYATTGITNLGTDALVKDFTQRICQAVGIDHSDGKCYWLLPAGAEGRKAWVESLNASWRVDASAATWLARFYPQ
jgi:hypothetical protein